MPGKVLVEVALASSDGITSLLSKQSLPSSHTAHTPTEKPLLLLAQLDL